MGEITLEFGKVHQKFEKVRQNVIPGYMFPEVIAPHIFILSHTGDIPKTLLAKK